ncbi:TPA: hypothetical protein ACH3X1_010440 [Trebouxia sp. C0004]
MATRQARRAANKDGSIYSVKTGFKQIFTDARLAATTLQAILNAASLMARTNFANHVATNFFSRTLHWFRLHLKQHIYFAVLEYKLVKSWAKYVCRAATEGLNNIWDLLPRYTSLAQLPAATMDYLEYLMATIQSLIGPLPVTDGFLQRQPESYLPWLHMVLLDFHDVAGVDGLPPLTSRGETGCKAFIANQNSWWEHHTDCIQFSKRAEPSRRRFKQVQTDGVSVSVLMFQPHVDSPAASSTTPSAPPASKKRRRQEQSVIEWVQGLPDRHLVQPPRIVGLDPGRKALFTAVVHSQQAADSLHGGHLSRNPALDAALKATPTAKVASSAQFLQHIRHRMQHTTAAQAHYGDSRHRQLRWRSFIKRQQAYSAICKTISGGSSDTVVAYGDAKFSSSCCKGNPSTPTVSLRRKLGNCCQVYDTDEFHTSKLCCACKTAMDGMPLPPLGNPGRHAPDLF